MRNPPNSPVRLRGAPPSHHTTALLGGRFAWLESRALRLPPALPLLPCFKSPIPVEPEFETLLSRWPVVVLRYKGQVPFFLSYHNELLLCLAPSGKGKVCSGRRRNSGSAPHKTTDVGRCRRKSLAVGGETSQQ